MILGSMGSVRSMLIQTQMTLIEDLTTVILVRHAGVLVCLIDFKAAETVAIRDLIHPLFPEGAPVVDVVIMSASSNDDRFKNVFKDMGRMCRVSAVLAKKYEQYKLVQWLEARRYLGQIIICEETAMLRAAVAIFL